VFKSTGVRAAKLAEIRPQILASYSRDASMAQNR